MMVPVTPVGRPTFLPLVLLSAAATLLGCAGDGVRGSECESDAECAPGFSCVDGLCIRPQSTSDSLGDGIDAGSTSHPDAGYVPPDAGNVDATPAEGDSGPDPVVDAGGVCGTAACAAQGAECDEIVDDCGFAVSCGSCEDGYECGTGPFANRCQCNPRQCEPGQCGEFSDGCGVPLQCSCGGGQTCVDSQCCTPRKCSDVGVECGDINDGCGGTVQCGSCTGPNTCGGGGSPGRCGCTPRVCEGAYRDGFRAHPDTDCGSPSNGCGGQIPNCGACNVLTNGWSLTTAQSRLIFNNGRMRLSWQADGNLVLYRGTGFSAAWASNTHGRGTRLVFQPDGNFLIRDAGGRAIWSSDTWRQPGERLVLTSTCNLVIYDAGDTVRWQTRTSC